MTLRCFKLHTVLEAVTILHLLQVQNRYDIPLVLACEMWSGLVQRAERR
jgi:hypothetical protein